jgi:hypothetical protein
MSWQNWATLKGVDKSLAQHLSKMRWYRVADQECSLGQCAEELKVVGKGLYSCTFP